MGGKRLLTAAAILLAAAIPAANAAAATFTVNTSDDVDTGSCTSIHCSLRSAINAANAAAGSDTIAFAIPGPNPHTILPLSALPPVADRATIDGTTQAGYAGSPVVELDGAAAGDSNGLQLLPSASGSTVRGLTVNRFQEAGVLVGEGPTGSGMGAGSDNNVLAGNYFGTDVTGMGALGNRIGVDISGTSDGNTIGGTNARDRNVVSGNTQFGVVVEGQGFTLPSNNVIVGNYVGVDATGNRPLGNTITDIVLQSSPDNTVGGPLASQGNVIGGSLYGIRILNTAATGNVVQGNAIGIGADGSSNAGNVTGVDFVDAPNGTLGGTGAGNVIALNSGPGVVVEDSVQLSAVNDAILGNSIFSNGSLGIDLYPPGVTPNDPGDNDPGPNQLQNFPQLSSAGSGDGGTSVSGTLNSMPITTYRLEFFSNAACDPSGNGEGQTFLGAADVTTATSGNASFTFTFGGATAGPAITATATDPAGNTSEFSNCATAQAAAASTTLTPAAAVNNVGTSHTVTATVMGVGIPPEPLAGVVVRFSVEGSVTVSGTCTTDANGQCSFTYQGPQLPGADLITAYPDLNNDGVEEANELSGGATKAWFAPASTPGQVTGGGQAPNFAGGSSIAFGFNAQSTAGGPKGECTVVDQGSGTKIKCLSVTSLVVTGTHATFFGDATINGVATTYRIDVDDLAEPGTGRDTFAIQTESGYVAGGVLTNGNIQIHQ